MRETHHSIADGLCSNIEETLTHTLLEKFKTIFANYQTVREKEKETEQRLNHMRANNVELQREVKDLEGKFQERLKMYLYECTFDDTVRKLAKQEEVD